MHTHTNTKGLILDVEFRYTGVLMADEDLRLFQSKSGEEEIKASATATLHVPLLFESHMLESLKLRMMQWAAGLHIHYLPQWFYPQSLNVF